jgi:hypothetical protein
MPSVWQEEETMQMSMPWDSPPSNSAYVMAHGVNLLPQDNNMACWWASMLMMYEWRKIYGGSPVDPHTLAGLSSRHKANNGLPWAQMRIYAQQLGMRPKPLATPTIDLLASWLRAGPLWTDGIMVDWTGNVVGTGHVVVLAGLRSVQNSNEYEIYVYDPWPVLIGHEGWRPLSHLTTIMLAGANPKRDVTFLSY